MASARACQWLAAAAVLTQLIGGASGTGRSLPTRAVASRADNGSQITLWGSYNTALEAVTRRHLAQKAGAYSGTYEAGGYAYQSTAGLADYGVGYVGYGRAGGDDGAYAENGYVPGGDYEYHEEAVYVPSAEYDVEDSILPFSVLDPEADMAQETLAEEGEAITEYSDVKPDGQESTFSPAQLFPFAIMTRSLPGMDDVSPAIDPTPAPSLSPTPAPTQTLENSPTEGPTSFPFLAFAFIERNLPGMDGADPTDGPTSSPTPSPTAAVTQAAEDEPASSSCIAYRVFFVLQSKPVHTDVDFIAELLPSFGSAHGVLEELESDHVYDWLNHEVLPNTCDGWDRMSYDSTPFSMTTFDWDLAIEMFIYVSEGELLESIREQEVFCGVVLSNDKVRIESTNICVEQERELEKRTAGQPIQVPGLLGQDPLWVWNPGET